VRCKSAPQGLRTGDERNLAVGRWRHGSHTHCPHLTHTTQGLAGKDGRLCSPHSERKRTVPDLYDARLLFDPPSTAL